MQELLVFALIQNNGRIKKWQKQGRNRLKKKGDIEGISCSKKSFGKLKTPIIVLFAKPNGHAGKIFFKGQMLKSSLNLAHLTKTIAGHLSSISGLSILKQFQL